METEGSWSHSQETAIKKNIYCTKVCIACTRTSYNLNQFEQIFTIWHKWTWSEYKCK